MFNSVENKVEMTFKCKMCKAWFALYSEVQIDFRTVGRMLVVMSPFTIVDYFL